MKPLSSDYARWSLCTSFAKSIKVNGGGESNVKNTWYISQIKFYCMGVEGWKISDFIDLKAITPQLTTADIPLTAGVENAQVKADIPLSSGVEDESKKSITTADIPIAAAFKTEQEIMPIIQVLRANKCKLNTCFNEVPEMRKDFCSDKCRIKYNNNKRSTKSA